MGTFWDNIGYADGVLFPINTAFCGPLGIWFSNSDFNADKDLEIEHGKETLLVTAKLYDPNGRERDTSNYFQIVDKNNCKLVNGGDLDEGKYLLILEYMSI
jgi:hypothetical protein